MPGIPAAPMFTGETAGTGQRLQRVGRLSKTNCSGIRIMVRHRGGHRLTEVDLHRRRRRRDFLRRCGRHHDGLRHRRTSTGLISGTFTGSGILILGVSIFGGGGILIFGGGGGGGGFGAG